MIRDNTCWRHGSVVYMLISSVYSQFANIILYEKIVI